MVNVDDWCYIENMESESQTLLIFYWESLENLYGINNTRTMEEKCEFTRRIDGWDHTESIAYTEKMEIESQKVLID